MAYFLKHLTEETIALNRLLIPQEFVTQCGRFNLTNPVVLEPPVGDPVELELYEDVRGFWLRNGWRELVDQYSLRHGHYVVFEYKSYSRFKVLMLGENGVGLEFPAPSFVGVGSNRNQEFREAEEEEKTVNISVEFLGSSFVMDMNHSNNSVGGGRQQALRRSGKSRTTDGGKKRKENWEASQRNRGNRSSFERHEAENPQNPSMADEPVAKRPSRCPSMESNENQDFTESGKEGDFVDADYVEFLGVSFPEEMNNNNTGGSVRQPPQPRCAENAKQKECMSARRRTRANGGESRKMNNEVPRSYRGNGSPYGRENAETSHIPSMADQEASKIPSSSRSGRPTTTTADGLTSEPDFLLRPVTKRSLDKTGLRMLGGFVERHIANWNGKMVKLQVKEETWPVRIMLDGVPCLSKGWWAFARHYSLKVGDVLMFVPTKTEDLLSVHIQRLP